MHRFHRLFMPLLFPLMLLAACSNPPPETAPAPTETILLPAPTEAPPTATAPPPSPTVPLATPTSAPPTVTPEATDAAPMEAPTPAQLELGTEPYVHSEGFFSLMPPLGWAIDEDQSSASFADPEGPGFIYVQVTNTSYPLEGDAFSNFVGARETNYFTPFGGYEVVDETYDVPNGVARITKNVLFDGIPHTVTSVYDQYGAIIYNFDFWTDAANNVAYGDLYERLLNSLAIDSGAASSQVEYNWIYTFTGPGDLFTIEVPTAWRYERTEGDTAVVDTFYSPDDHGIIQNITYDDGDEVTKSEAGAFALELMRSYYADDLRILGDQVQPDGSERLVWTSPSGGYSGTTFLETRGTTFLLFTTMVDDPYEADYLDTLNYTIDSYAIP
jgi:hypothetical protein